MNCAQAVVIAFSDELDFDREMAARISCGFGGGMGRLQETCGAATGSFMVLGIHVGESIPITGTEKRKHMRAFRNSARDSNQSMVYSTASHF